MKIGYTSKRKSDGQYMGYDEVDLGDNKKFIMNLLIKDLKEKKDIKTVDEYDLKIDYKNTLKYLIEELMKEV